MADQTPLRQRVYDLIENPDRSSAASKLIDLGLILLITVNVVAVTLETIESLYTAYKPAFAVLEIVSVAVFTVEYLLRLWVCAEEEPHRSAASPRLSYATTPMALIDLAAILPFYLSAIFAIDLRFLRVLRLLRVFKLTRYSSAMTMLLNVFREEASAFFAGFFILFVLLILAASGAYLVEHQVQPDKFGSIPHSMWWAMATLTTVGYGDVTPVTALGKVFGGLVTIVGIGMAALPAGILASGLADQLHRRRDDLRDQFRLALEDGVIDMEEAAEIERLRKELGIGKDIAEKIHREVMERQVSRCTCPECGARFSPEAGANASG